MNKDLVFAVMIDGENIGSGLLGQIVSEVERFGSIAVRKVYGDWTQTSMSTWKDALHQYSFRPEQQFHYGKDAADHALIMDVIELVSTNRRINAICVASSDGGFHSLAQRVRERGLYMMGIGRRHTPERFIKACLNFVYIDNLETATSAVDQPVESHDIETLLMQAYLNCAEANETVSLAQLGNRLKSIDSAFDPRTYGHATLKKMIKNHPEIFSIENETTSQCYIGLNKKNKNDVVKLRGSIKRWLGAYGFIECADSNWYFYRGNISEDQRGVKIRAGMAVEFTPVKHPDPDATETTEKNGKAAEVRLLLES